MNYWPKVLLWGIATKEAAGQWQEQLAAREQRHGSFIRERTYAQDPNPGQRKWRYTHERVRSAYRQLAKLLRDNQLFTYLDGTVTTVPIPRTTKYVEGGINPASSEPSSNYTEV